MAHPRPEQADASGAPVGTAPAWSVIVLTGGSSTRMGTRKDVLDLDGVPVVVRLLHGLPADVPVVVVGPAPPAIAARDRTHSASPAAAIVVTREEPPGGGPVAGIAAGLRLVRSPVVAIAAGDMPFAGPLLARLVRRFGAASSQAQATSHDAAPATEPTGRDEGLGSSVPANQPSDPASAPQPAAPELHQPRPEALLPLDADGQPQPLCAVYDTAALQRVITALGPPAGLSMRQLVGSLRIASASVDDEPALLDIDTPADLARARARLVHPPGAPAIMATSRSAGGAMKQWIDAVKQELGLDIDVDVAQVLDVAKDAAHSVQRPAAPVTTYLLGYAVASGADPGEAAGVVRRLANTWSAPE